MKGTIVHISEVDITEETGMGRIELHWKKEFEKAGYTFIHIGPGEIGKLSHKAMFGWKAKKYFKRLGIKPCAFIVHEPLSGFFVNKKIPVFVESHGVERRFWEINLNKRNNGPTEAVSFKTRVFYPVWRLLMCDKGLKKAHKLLLSNSDDASYAKCRYKREARDIYLFKNGVHTFEEEEPLNKPADFTVLFNASWIPRKGIHTLVEAAEILSKLDLKITYLLIGTGKAEEEVLKDWPAFLRGSVKVIPFYHRAEEHTFLNNSMLFILPSFSEGQPLSLLQAMHAGKCCITTNCCGQKDIIQHGVNGLLFEPGNVEELASLVLNCYTDFNLITTVGNKAKDSVRTITWEKVSGEVVEFVTCYLEDLDNTRQKVKI